jgi:hypothetical protein
VAVLSHPEGQIVQSVFSGDDGRFSLSGLPPAKYQLTASKRGFRTAYFDQHDDYNSAVVTGPDQDTSNLTFRLTPDAVLHGVVTDEAGDPVEGAQVMLFRKPAKPKSTERITQAGSAKTDDTGAYEFSSLAPGQYLLAVKAKPWYALPHASGLAQPSPTESAASALDVAYPITFFSDTTDEASAAPVSLAAGAREEANFNLHPVPALHLTIPLQSEAREGRDRSGASSIPQIPRTVLHQSVFGTEISVDEVGFINVPQGVKQADAAGINGVAPGHYQVELGNPPRFMDLEANSNQQIDPALATPSIPVAAILRSSAGLPPAEIHALTLESLDAAHSFIPMQAPPHPGESFTAAVPPGNWKVWAVSESNSWMVLSISTDGSSQPGNRFTVRDHPLSLTLTATQTATRIEGFARKDGKGISGAMVVLFSINPHADSGLIRRDQSDSDGSFALLDIAPGSYLLVAIQDAWDLDWADPKVMARYLSEGIPVTIKSDSGKLMRLAQPVPVQSAASTP